MSIEKIKNIILSNMDKTINFKVNGSRNQVEEFSGKIISAYPAVFTVRCLEKDMVRSFSYADILIGDLELLI